MVHLRRYLAALAVLSGLFGAYALAVAPWVEPPPVKARPPAPPLPPVQPSEHTRADLLQLFPPGAWERDTAKVKVIETRQATLLIQDYLPTPDGRLQLKPCTIIFYTAADQPADKRAAAHTEALPRRPIVLRAPQGAVLEFDQPLDLARAKFGRLIKGKLAGDISIYSPSTSGRGDDQFSLTTRDVQLDRDRIFTPHAVEFRYGQSFGSGRDLTIALLNDNDDAQAGSKSSSGTVQSITLSHIDRLHIAAEGRGLVGAMQSEGKPATMSEEPLEVTCRGPFTFNVLSRVARFEEQVQVQRRNAMGPPDRLHNCDELMLVLAPANKDDLSGSKGTALGSQANRGATHSAAGKLQRMVAIGSPALLEAPSQGVKASAAWMEYALDRRLITLKPNEEQLPVRKVASVSLEQHGQHFIARDLQYEMAGAGRLGRLLAQGPGELRLLQGRAPASQAVIARWEKQLRIRPHEKNQAVSLEGNASVTAELLGRFDANELHLWLLEVPTNEDSSPHGPREGIVSRSETTTIAPQRTTIHPDRLLAIGDVRLTSPHLDAKTARLEAWFINVPPAEKAPAPPPPMPGLLREPVQPVAFAGSHPSGLIREMIPAPNLQKFTVSGDLMRMQLLAQGRKFDLEDLTIRGNAAISETRTSEPGQEPIQIVGDLLELRRGTTPQAIIELTGKPAEAAGRGLSLAGGKIHVHRGENRLWIDGPGEATLPAPDEQSLSIGTFGETAPLSRRPQAAHAEPGAGAGDKRIHLVWQQGLTFDGLTTKLTGEVQARTATQLALCQTLDATLRQRIDFAAPSGGQKAEIARLRLDGGVFVENRGVDERREQSSLDQMKVPNLTIDQTAGMIHADGPGWVSTVRRGSMDTAGTAPLGTAVPRLGPANLAGDSQSLTSVHVAFERAIEGYLNKRQIEFQHQVRTTYSPARDFTDQIIAQVGQPLREVGERAVLMTSDRLKLTEMVEPGRSQWIEMQAAGNVVVEGLSFTATGAEVNYSSDKEAIRLEGDGRSDAEISYVAVAGARPSVARARKFTYWMRSGVVKGEDFSIGDGWLGGAIQLPSPRR